MKEIIAIIAIGVFLIVATIASIAWAAYEVDRSSCLSGWADSGYTVRFDYQAGCRISRDGGHTWIPSATAREGIP